MKVIEDTFANFYKKVLTLWCKRKGLVSKTYSQAMNIQLLNGCTNRTYYFRFAYSEFFIKFGSLHDMYNVTF